MNIGLLISKLEDPEVKKVCLGAREAAREKGVNLFVLPGRYLYTDKTVEENKPYDYQSSALFDYAKTSDFDVLIIDIERIGKKIPILKKEAFLKGFQGIPVITLTKQDGFMSVNSVESGEYQYEQLGYEAVCDAIFYADNQIIPPASANVSFPPLMSSSENAFAALSRVSNILLHRKYPMEKAYLAFAEDAKNEGINNCGILLFDKKVRNTIKYGWDMPESITVKSALINGSIAEFPEGNMYLKTDKIVSNFTKDEPSTFIMGNLFVGEDQLGVMVTELSDNMFIDYFFVNLVSTINGLSRIAYLEKMLKKTTEDLYEVQEELARDDSVLDHIGDQDYLTGGLNRRGFFAKAYDFLKDNFKPGTTAIVAYIHMESLKNINDMYGHEEGDRAVKKVAGILQDVFEGCIYGRIRGDEFAIIDITQEDGKGDIFRQEMSTQNTRLLDDTSRYINHLQYSICEFGYDEDLSLREMLKETDENLQRIKGNYL